MSSNAKNPEVSKRSFQTMFLKVDSSDHPSLMTRRGSGKGEERERVTGQIQLEETTVYVPLIEIHMYVKILKALGHSVK